MTVCQWTDNPANPFIADPKRGYPPVCREPARHRVLFTWTKGPSAGEVEIWECCEEHFQALQRRTLGGTVVARQPDEDEDQEEA